MKANPEKILLINFGQLGDVILSLPAMTAVAKRFEGSHMTGLLGKSAAGIAHLSGLFDDVIEVDRVGLLRGPKVRSVLEILNLARDIRRRKFDLVIDLHSLPETNLLGFVSGAPIRLFANREGRSIDRLSNFRPKPPAEDKSINATLNYLRSVESLGISTECGPARLNVGKGDREFVKSFLPDRGKGHFTIALNPGAGHVSRRWKFSKFAELAHRLAADPRIRVMVLLGPEENELRERIDAEFPENIVVPPIMTLGRLAAVLEHTDLMVSNDTGVMHLAAAMGATVVVVMQEVAPERFLPYFGSVEVVKERELDDVAVDRVHQCVIASLGLSQDTPGR